MKATDLSRILRALERPTASQRIEVPKDVRERARRPIERMFELAEDSSAS
jgi:quinolinate synthase